MLPSQNTSLSGAEQSLGFGGKPSTTQLWFVLHSQINIAAEQYNGVSEMVKRGWQWRRQSIGQLRLSDHYHGNGIPFTSPNSFLINPCDYLAASSVTAAF
jgi:hypothetical protein